MRAKDSPDYLSKSLYIRGLQCHKSLYLHKFHPELRDEVSDASAARLQGGKDVGAVAQQLFPGGVEVPYEGLSISEQVAMTQKLMRSKGVIYEASFSHDGIFVKVDILRKGRRGWEIYEVKASTKVKDVYLDDAALQYHVLNGIGINVDKVFIVHIDNSYVRTGELDVKGLFVKSEVTKEVVDKQTEVAAQIKAQRKMLRGKLPKTDIGPYCSAPYECDFQGHCWQDVPEDSVFDLAGKGVDKFDLYRNGIVRQKDIPRDLLNAKQRQQVEATIRRRNTVDKKKVREFLSELWYPLCFLDFETFMPAVPLYAGTKPYQPIPFQYSLHLLKRKGGKLHHRAFLAEPGVDPRKALLEQLLDDIPEDACVLTYNKSFERNRLNELAEAFPRKAKKIRKIIANIRDLMLPFQRRDVYFWQMKGSYSIKQVLPAIVPDLSYDGLAISDGGMAMEGWWRMCSAESREEVEKIRKDLLDYCVMDTLAMVEVYFTLSNKKLSAI